MAKKRNWHTNFRPVPGLRVELVEAYKRMGLKSPGRDQLIELVSPSFATALESVVGRTLDPRTPPRFARAMIEMTSGYHQEPAAILARTFPVKCDEMVVVTGIRFWSLCEHHLLPFEGTAVVGYIPGKRIVGLSKLPRLVECFARRLQVQERLTQEIASAIQKHLKPRGVGVLVKARHTCMAMRGVRSDGKMVTSALLGAIRTEPSARAEFLELARSEMGGSHA